MLKKRGERPVLCVEYDATFDGFLSALFEAFLRRGEQVVFSRGEGGTPPLMPAVRASADDARARRLLSGMDRLSKDLKKTVYRAWLSGQQGIDDDILGCLRTGFEKNLSPLEMRYIPCCARVINAAHAVGLEQQRFLQFVRFKRAGEDFFVADIEPLYDILPLIGDHFHKRYLNQRFVIRDLSRLRGLLSDQTGWEIIALEPRMCAPVLEGSAEALWRAYFQAIANPARKNTKLQQKFIPLRYRRYLTEFE